MVKKIPPFFFQTKNRTIIWKKKLFGKFFAAAAPQLIFTTKVSKKVSYLKLRLMFKTFPISN
jgi:hypothetical protein